MLDYAKIRSFAVRSLADPRDARARPDRRAACVRSEVGQVRRFTRRHAEKAASHRVFSHGADSFEPLWSTFSVNPSGWSCSTVEMKRLFTTR